MSQGDVVQLVMDETAADARLAALEFDDASAWLEEARQRPMEPLAAEVWVTDPASEHVLLVKHRVRGWVPPGGKVEPGEAPRVAAARELLEETGLRAALLEEPAAVAVRSYRADWSPTLGLSYAAVVDPATPLGGEQGQPAAWFRLDEDWQSVFPDDRHRIRAHARRLAAAQDAEAH
ncbi:MULTISPECIES: NUDIX hydrolase [Streptomyces]|uniref:8-oxo-dGTP diphosphatase n=2 Tax=Streptomyces clavifer TaxID=68188 RepID=A0ABS4VHU8_9ACTN|nr:MULTISPECIES: NUDIX hydrolase [Streptomyces]MBP2363494.1 8-oxo-dGTP diphosphatase [Streptomyces clavifer]MDX2748414.1 NUDIX hydrolase [Streptomyces sp. NRRL_B-2557]WRY79870.1 NUDIX hydrolase [Streptomyces clavifer]WRY86448.1 NUDIX hydrolase [Streptomyces clavifer]